MNEKLQAIGKNVYNSLTACQTFSRNRENKPLMYSLGQAVANITRLFELTKTDRQKANLLAECLGYISDAKEQYKGEFYWDGDVALSNAIDAYMNFKRSFR